MAGSRGKVKTKTVGWSSAERFALQFFGRRHNLFTLNPDEEPAGYRFRLRYRRCSCLYPGLVPAWRLPLEGGFYLPRKLCAIPAATGT